MSLTLGDRIKLGSKYSGTIEYIGELSGKEGVWAGLRLDEPLGTSNGTYNGVRYFYAEDKCGLFARYTRLTKTRLENSYATNEMPFHDSLQYRQDSEKHDDKDILKLSCNDMSLETKSTLNSIDNKHKDLSKKGVVEKDPVLTKRSKLMEGNHSGLDNLFVRYDDNYVSKLKEQIEALKLAVEEERKKRAETEIWHKKSTLNGTDGKMGILSKKLGTKIHCIQNDIKVLDSMLKNLKEKIKIPKDRSDIAGLVETIVTCITKSDVDGLNKSLKAYTGKIREQGISFDF